MGEQFIKDPTFSLGKKSDYESSYNPKKLFAIARASKRQEINIDPESLPFYGEDTWNHYEVSWLNPKGKPMVAIAQISYNADSPSIIESKSMKLYFNTFNQSVFQDMAALRQTITDDITHAINYPVKVALFDLDNIEFQETKTLRGICLDHLDIDCQDFVVNPGLLKTNTNMVSETLYSNLLKSNCLVTFQPDWGSVQIIYHGPQIIHESLLQYLVSFRNHNEFHEQCIERIFIDIMQKCQPSMLTVYGKYTRRGGVDINPIRSTEKDYLKYCMTRLIRQ